ncbi:MAG TPA: hypothetical protein VKY89_16895, partial [Thermoanaerobaculia bacterium]|nr:hypothetical protein [Thermoanaerobaculia bacterium]
PEPRAPRERLEQALGPDREHPIHSCKLTARRYMARLRCLLGDQDQAGTLTDAKKFGDWLSPEDGRPAGAQLF